MAQDVGYRAAASRHRQPVRRAIRLGRTLHALVALSLASFAGIFAFTAGAGLSGSLLAAAAIAVVAGAGVALWVWRTRSLPLDPGAGSRGLKIVSGVATIVALIQLGRLAVFMVASSQVACSLVLVPQAVTVAIAVLALTPGRATLRAASPA